jgi:hypothetical protein
MVIRIETFLPSVETCDYFLESKIGPTEANPSNTTVRTIYGLLVGKNYDPTMESGLDAGGISSGIYVEIEWTNNLVSQNITKLFILHDRWIQINPNGTTLLIQ